MSTFCKLRNYLNSLTCGDVFTLNDIYENLDKPDEDRTSSSLIDVYLYGFEAGGIIKSTENWTEYILKHKITQKVSLLDFLEKAEGDNWKEWFVQLRACEE